MSAGDQELVAAFAQAGLPLHHTLVEMLNEHPSHRTDRRGCGLTQSTRFLSTYINQPRSQRNADDLEVLAKWPEEETEVLAAKAQAAGWSDGWRRLDQAPDSVIAQLPASPTLDALRRLGPALRAIAAGVQHPESRLVANLIEQLLSGDGPAAPEVPGMPAKPEIGSCSQAEEFFLEIAHGRVRRHGSVNVFVDADEQPLLLEKMNLGESHSAIVIAPIRINGVQIPAGGLCALRYVDPTPDAPRCAHGFVRSLAVIAQARFLRLTTLSVEPRERRRAFSSQIEAQIHLNFVSPLSTTLAHLRDYAQRELAAIQA